MTPRTKRAVIGVAVNRALQAGYGLPDDVVEAMIGVAMQVLEQEEGWTSYGDPPRDGSVFIGEDDQGSYCVVRYNGIDTSSKDRLEHWVGPGRRYYRAHFRRWRPFPPLWRSKPWKMED